jgi:hypothetical protein
MKLISGVRPILLALLLTVLEFTVSAQTCTTCSTIWSASAKPAV